MMHLPEYRLCPLTGRVSLIAPQRDARPHQDENPLLPCPFCPGHERETPPAVATLSGDAGWQVRVVPNRFPAVCPDAPAFGYHEVVIEGRNHVSSPVEFSDELLADILRLHKDRLLALAADARIQYVTIFRNVGAAAGASLAHSHSQIVATPFVPPALRAELALAGSPCGWCELLAHETTHVAANDGFAAVCPPAPRFPYETWILPRTHASHYERETNFAALAQLLKRVLAALGPVPFNLLLKTAPPKETSLYHWHLELLPRTTTPAGFEWATGAFIHGVSPERAAAELRRRMLV